MYKSVLRPILFMIDPEKVHHLVVSAVKLLDHIPGFKPAMRNFTVNPGFSGSVTVAGLHFNNRVGLAAGFDKNADFYSEFSMFGFSFVEIGTVTPKPQAGNPKPRLFRLKKDKALINRMGFNNKGVDYAVNQLRSRDKSLIIGGNIGKNTATSNDDAANDYAICFEKLYDMVDYFAINVSCPNIKGMEKLQDIASLRKILDRIMEIRKLKNTRKPVFLKISPDLTLHHLDEILDLCGEEGVDGIIAANTTTAREGLSEDPVRVKKAGPGGISGKPLTNRALKMIGYICKHTDNKLPVIGVGGILNTRDALEMIKAGASLLQVYTGFIYEGPFLVRRINHAIAEYFQSGVYNPVTEETKI